MFLNVQQRLPEIIDAYEKIRSTCQGLHGIVSKETYYSVKRDTLKVSTVEAFYVVDIFIFKLPQEVCSSASTDSFYVVDICRNIYKGTKLAIQSEKVKIFATVSIFLN